MSDLVRAITRLGLVEDDHWPAKPLDDTAFRRLARAVARERIDGLAHEAVLAGLLPVTDGQAARLRAAHEEVAAVALQLDRQLLDVQALLASHGIGLLALKGPAVAHLDHDDPALRRYNDIDVLLRAQDMAAAEVVLVDHGYQRVFEQLRPGFDARFGKGTTLTSPRGYELDIHRTLAFGAFAFGIDVTDLWDGTRPFALGGRTVHALGDPQRFLHACYHAALGDPMPRMTTMRDMVLSAPPSEQQGEVLALIDAWRGRAVVGRALQLLHARLDIELAGPLAALRHHEPTWLERFALWAQVSDHRSFATQVVAAMPFLRGWRDRIDLVRAALLPDATTRRSLGTAGRLAWLRRGVLSLLGGRRDG